MDNTAEMWRAFWAGFIVWPVLIVVLIGLVIAVQKLRDKWIGDQVQELRGKFSDERAALLSARRAEENYKNALNQVARIEPGKLSGEALERHYEIIYKFAKEALYRESLNWSRDRHSRIE